MTRTNKPYTIFINRRPIKVDLRTFICHCTLLFKGLQPESTYNEFIRDFRFKSIAEVRDYITTEQVVKEALIVNTVMTVLGSGFEGGLVETIAAIDYKSYIRSAGVLLPDFVVYTNAMSLYINFCERLTFSEAYESIQPLTQFYHSLIYKITDDDYLERRDIIYPEDIDKVLEDLRLDVRFDDIREDLEKHLVLLRFDDHYEWAGTKIAKWLWKIPYTHMYRVNTLKLLTQIRYNVPPKRF